LTIREEDINDLTSDEALRRFLKDRISREEVEDETMSKAPTPKPSNGKGKSRLSKIKPPKTSLSIMGGSSKVDYTKFEHVSNETVNLHVSGILPASDKLRFIDPQAVALPNKAIPRLKVILDAMSKNIKKSPLPWIAIGVMAIIAAIALSIVYDRIIEPAQDAERAYQLELQSRGGNATGLEKPESLFQFNPINPFAKPPES